MFCELLTYYCYRAINPTFNIHFFLKQNVTEFNKLQINIYLEF